MVNHQNLRGAICILFVTPPLAAHYGACRAAARKLQGHTLPYVYMMYACHNLL